MDMEEEELSPEEVSWKWSDHHQIGMALSRITSTGAMTFSFIRAIEEGHATTYGSLLSAMRSQLKTASDSVGGGPITSLLTMLLTGGISGGGFKQEPQLTSNDPFDVYMKPFSL